ncbi:PREDICTED: Golgi membrane protein 1 [Chinchilla lanigera]|uniref:Golgi membrane protein 1 n=1 Tax=Chinchilla lanigera TaxID=34839 RepID=A0A8C2VE03_CHILA|nr:PREDICTED: Golgi membrane protein 1 [Chinchilla lanigera]XP_013371408.1 PREDICTED: Golgi membrane protein 1 [Chinchilla lanigera]XP_013371409.1 PREDICTED: Golgi membrane protein 1 [Chinchilla lanigera]XP_013371410.1 PREDICTED: Golgi membrane protein 1 [Chinchilla lanigera]XP_013371411.1 PREDICTED: Golgi membrane protein 1 [Chinchilla lanigera]XP_013371412.1 PREDICTED: Golgi membrane protein 1 [Chinchilla lanigera]XP_013371413.1 PREDICTED: Golgi membrane protein 1 [Chinchilla lanigera]XP_0
MMGLGNGRRSMKSPPLLLAALVACIIVLGFNYWIASSRSVELQKQILELEGRVRRAAAERGAVELKKNEFQGELEKQREQLDKIQSSHSFQLESVNKLYQDEKAALVSNITTGERLIRDLQDQLKALQRSYGRLHQDVLQFRRNQTNLERKFSYDLNQCINQMKEVKEQCEERIEEITRKGNEAAASRGLSKRNDQAPSESQPRLQGAGLLQAAVPQAKGSVSSKGKSQTPQPHSETVLELKGQEETNEIQPVSEEAAQRDSGVLPREPGQGQAAQDMAVAGEGLGGAGELVRTTQVPVALSSSPEHQEPEEPERDQLVIREGPEEQAAAREGQNQQKTGADDYNLDENEAESETDKQAALAGSDRNLNVFNAEKRDIIHLFDQHEKRNHTL